MTATAHESRFVLEGDHLHIGFHGEGKAPYPEDIVAPAVLRAIAQHLKVDLKTQGIFWGDYCYFAATTGEAFRFLEFMKLGKPIDKAPLVERYGSMTRAEMFRNALASAGLVAQVHQRPDMPDPATLREQIIQSLRDRNTPVIGLGGFGNPEPFLITGYDDAGEILIGWSHFQKDRAGTLSFEPSGQFRLRDWYADLAGVVIITARHEVPSGREVVLATLQRGIRELNEQGAGGDVLGLAAMSKWAEYLEGDFAGLSAPQWSKAHEEHSTTAGDLAERRALASSFMEWATRFCRELAPDLLAASSDFQGSHDTVYEIWEAIARSGPFDPDLTKFQSVEGRRTSAALVRKLIAFDRRAIAHLERALRIARQEPPGEALAPDPMLDGDFVVQKAAANAKPRIWAPQNISMPNSMVMLQEFLGETIGDEQDQATLAGKDYAIWMGLSGAAFGMLADGAERTNLPLMFDALGYDYDIWMNGELGRELGIDFRDWGWDDNLRRRIYWNLRDRKLPVLLFNVGKWPDWWLVTECRHWNEFHGYGGDNGEGYRPNDPLDSEKNPRREIKLMEQMKGKKTWTVNVLAKRTKPRPPFDEICRRAIELGAARLRDQKMKILNPDGTTFISDLPYSDWEQMMRNDALFPAADPAVLKARREALLGDEVELAERRFYGAIFLDFAAKRLDKPEISEAASHFRKAYGLVEQIWDLSGGPGKPERENAYASAETRNRIADLILQIEQEDNAAAELLAKAVGR